MNSIALIGRLILALALVLAVMWAMARVAQRRGRGKSRGQVLTVLARQSVSRNSSIAIVKVMDRAMVVGLSDGHVTLLGDTDLAAVEDLAGSPVSSRRAAIGSGAVLHAVADAGPDRAARPTSPSSHRRRADARSVRSGPTRSRYAARSTTRAAGGPLAGSALSLTTWKQAVEAIRERTVRRA